MGTRAEIRAAYQPLDNHPHAYGDKLTILFHSDGQKGSSPRVWGQVYFFSFMVILLIIPSRMGTSCEEKNKYRLTWDHPHACGDKSRSSSAVSGGKGSSPRVWGQVLYLSLWMQFKRIIPTRVGTSVDFKQRHQLTKDHPHACGDKMLRIGAVADSEGSSPRVWGQVSVC